MGFSVLKYDTVNYEIEAVIVYYETIFLALGLKFEKK
jgi:hypothetical protein